MDVETEMTLAKLRAEIDELRSRLDAVEDEAADAAEGAEGGEDAEVRGSGQWDLPDADACAAGFTDATRSVETVPSTGLRQIYKFAGGGHAVTAADLTGDPPLDPLPVFLMRMKVDEGGANALSVAYCTMATLIEALAGEESSSSGGSDSGSDTFEALPPMPFDIRVANAAGAWSLQAWLPADQTMLVARNGVSAINDEFAEHVEDGWVEIATLGEAPTGILLVTVDIQSNPVDNSVEYSWRFVLGAPEESGIDWLDYPGTNRFAEVISRRKDTPTLVAVVVGTAVVQYHRGAISTFGMDVDSLAGDNRSMEIIEPTQAYQLWRFGNPDYRLETPLPLDDTEHYDRVQILVRQRGADISAGIAGPIELQYASLGVIAQALVDAITTPHDDYKPEDSPWKEAWDRYIGEGVTYLFEGGGLENLTLIYNRLDGRYWVKGGGHMDCYGSSIGNSPGSGPIIDLENYRLMRSTGLKTVDWEAMELWTTKLSIDWADRQLWDGASTERKALDWRDRLLYDAAGVKVCDWDNCKMYSPANGWLTIDWEAMQLYSHVFEYGPPVKSLDWSACTTYDAAGNTTMSWRVRQLMGAWSIASGGSFATPSLALNGTTVTGVATVAVVTGVDFVNQTVTTANIKVLT